MWSTGSRHTVATANGIDLFFLLSHCRRLVAQVLQHICGAPVFIMITNFTAKIKMVGFINHRGYAALLGCKSHFATNVAEAVGITDACARHCCISCHFIPATYTSFTCFVQSYCHFYSELHSEIHFNLFLLFWDILLCLTQCNLYVLSWIKACTYWPPAYLKN